MRRVLLAGLAAVASLTQVHPTKGKKPLKNREVTTLRKSGCILMPPLSIPEIDTHRIGKALFTRDAHTRSLSSKKILKQKNLQQTNSIHQADLHPEYGFAIIHPGKYYLAEDISFGPSEKNRNAISIVPDCVTLDLNGHCIRQSNGTAGGVGVFISHDSNVTVLNGTISNFSQWGIGVLDSKNITVDNITIDKCGDINFTESAGLAMSRCVNVFVKQSLFTRNRGAGLVIQSINKGFFTDIQSTQTMEANYPLISHTIATGMRISESSEVSLRKCSFLGAEATFATGLHIFSSLACQIDSVKACNNRAKSFGTYPHTHSSGILVTRSGPRNNSLYFYSCTCSNNSAAPNDVKHGSAGGFGIFDVDTLCIEDCHSTSNLVEGTPIGHAYGFVLHNNNNTHYSNCTASDNRCKAENNFRTGTSEGFSIAENRNVVIDLCSAKDNSVFSTPSSRRSEMGIKLRNVSGTLSNCMSSGHKRLNQNDNQLDGVGFAIENDHDLELTVRNNCAINNTGGGFIDLTTPINWLANYRDNCAFTVNTVNFSNVDSGNTSIDTWILGSPPTNSRFSNSQEPQWSNISINQLAD